MTHEPDASATLARRLLPMPRELVLTGGSARVAPDVMAWAGCRADGSRRAHRGTLPHPHHCLDLDAPQPAWLVERTHGTWCAGDARDAQGYTLTIARTSEGDLTASIDAASRAGLRSARATLVQLLRVCASDQPGATTVPCCVVRDAPAFATRGVLLDVSRCRVPRMDELLGVIDTLALLKCNHLQLYTEHTFAYSFGEDVWRGWSPITPDELRRLDAHCHTLGIDLAANQNCFGHLRHWLESPRFASLAETHGDWMFDVWPRSGPFSLCPTDPASRTFVRSMLAELLPCVRSGWVNIGCDETYDIAFGRSRDECTRQGRERVYARFVAQVVQDARALGKRSMFWGDVALTNPQCLDDIPRDAALLAWGYEPDAPFARWLEAARGDDSRHAEPREAWVCPGTSAWRSITGRTKERRGNIDRAARDGAMHDAAGILICEWGDMGHWQQWPVSALALGEALDAAWIGGLRQDDAGGAALDARATLAGAAAVHALGEDPDVGAWLADLGDADAALRRVCGGLSRPDRAGGPLPNASALFADLAHPFAATPNASNTHPAAPPGSREEWALVQARVDDATAALTRLNVRSPLVRDELAHTVTLARFACARALARRGHTTSVDLAAWRDSLAANHARLWRARSRLGGLDASLDYFARIDVGGSTAGGSTP